MRPPLELTSLPAWAVVPVRSGADTSGRYWTIVVPAGTVDAAVDEIVSAWVAQIVAARPGAQPRVHRVGDDDAGAAIDADLADAVVGWRLMIAGPADFCLRVRAHALGAGVADDEITVGSTEVCFRDVRCAHCATVTRAAVELEGIVPCSGCQRNLFVYYHVSRLSGAHLGFMADADEPGAAWRR